MVQKDIAARRCGLPAAIRASSVGSNICNAVGTLGKNFQLADGHVAVYLSPFSQFPKQNRQQSQVNTPKVHFTKKKETPFGSSSDTAIIPYLGKSLRNQHICKSHVSFHENHLRVSTCVGVYVLCVRKLSMNLASLNRFKSLNI
jgi:hypothetical protein